MTRKSRTMVRLVVFIGVVALLGTFGAPAARADAISDLKTFKRVISTWCGARYPKLILVLNTFMGIEKWKTARMASSTEFSIGVQYNSF